MQPQPEPQTHLLTFNVPEDDFGELDLVIALNWLKARVVTELAAPPHHVSSGLCYTYHLLQTVHSRYMDVVGKPGEKYPTYHQLVIDQNRADAGVLAQALGPVPVGGGGGGGETGKGMGEGGRDNG